MEKICKVCSKIFVPQHNTFGLYCSILCCNKDKHQLIETICAWCSNKFYQRPSDEKRFCSGSCGAKSSASKRSKISNLKKICLQCNKEFSTLKCENNDFCSHPCWLQYQTEHKLNMKIEFRNRPSVDEVRKAFRTQRDKLIESLKFIDQALSGVYIIINVITNMIYIGSSQDIEARWKEHVNKLCGNRHENDKLQKAWNKYGEKTFQFKILEAAEPLKLIEREQYYLDLYQSYKRHIGYNLFENAYSPLGSKRTEEQIERMRIVSKNQFPREIICQWCKTVFTVKGQNAKFCSHKCRDKARWQRTKALANN